MNIGSTTGDAAMLGVDDSPLSAAISARDRDTIKMVRHALRNRSVALAFQPVMRASGDRRPAYFEGLIRILESDGRAIPAREFIGAVETTELGRIIDCMSLELGLSELVRIPNLKLAVNMSARSIGYPRWSRTLERAFARDPSVGKRLILEITESSAMTMPELVTVFMTDLQKRGITFALDDFGSGFTSFRYLREFFFDIVKIDGQFIRDVASDPDNQVLTEALMSIARHFDMFTVAENVESAEDAHYLRHAGVDCMQGYFFGAPSLSPPWSRDRMRRKTA